MGFIDVLKSAGVAVAILIVNVALSFGVVALYSWFVDPGHDEAYYLAAAQWIAPLSSIALGWLLFFIATWTLSRNANRNALAFALAAFAVYAILDLSIIGASGELLNLLPTVALSLASKLVGAIGGVWAARR